ncbi:hypothetical protein CIB48_g1278 [Xylaria polymorpha]|nr:hypothetical protein CIB48_g1278 [Xylaria polymorpha]
MCFSATTYIYYIQVPKAYIYTARPLQPNIHPHLLSTIEVVQIYYRTSRAHPQQASHASRSDDAESSKPPIGRGVELGLGPDAPDAMPPALRDE